MVTDRRDRWGVASVARMRIPTRALLVGVIVLGILLAATVVIEARSSGIHDLPAGAGPAAGQPAGHGQFRFTPSSARVSPGVRYRFHIQTHCGLDWPVAVDFDGSFWDPAGPGPASDGNGNPPPGYANPVDQGTMILESPTTARYQSAGGRVMVFTRHPGPRKAWVCS